MKFMRNVTGEKNSNGNKSKGNRIIKGRKKSTDMNIRACKERERKNKIKFKRMSCQRRRRREEEIEIKNEKERKKMVCRIAPFKTRGG